MQSSQPDYTQYLQMVLRKKEWFVGIALLIFTLAILLSFALPRRYKAVSTVFIEKNVISEMVKGITVTPSMEDTIKVLSYAITSRTLLTKVIDNLEMNISGVNKAGNNEELIKSLQNRINIKVKDKNLFIITFTDANPRVARDFVNTLVRLYIEENLSSKRGESYDATTFLSEQINTFKEKLEKAENAVNSYKSEKGGIIAIDEAKLYESISQSQQKLHELEIQRRQLEASRKDLSLSATPLKANLNALQRKLEDLRAKYTDNYPEIIKIKAEIDSLNAQISAGGGSGYSNPELSRLDAQINAVKASEESLRRYINTNQATLRNIPTAKAGLEKLMVEKNNQKNLYDQLFARHGQSEVSKQMEVQDKSMTFRVVDPAILPIKPDSPNRLKIMVLGLAGGLAGALGILFLLENMTPTITSTSVAKSFGLPILAVVPTITDPEEQLLAQQRSKRILGAAAVYLLLLLCFPLLEIVKQPFVDRMLDQIYPTGIIQKMSNK